MPSTSPADLTTDAFLRGAWRYDEALYAQLRQRLDEPHRAYHNATHISACLLISRMYTPESVDREPLELAIWYHDAVYDTKAMDNEERSAALFKEHSEHMGLTSEVVQLVHACILATKHGDPSSHTHPVIDAMLDVDLSILGAEPTVFDTYDAAIRREYWWVVEDLYRFNRKRILESFLAKQRLYRTDSFHEQFDGQARLNLKRAIDRLV
jgi:predicted metal-dependent HD superfamily phosphohydrolase